VIEVQSLVRECIAELERARGLLEIAKD